MARTSLLYDVELRSLRRDVARDGANEQPFPGRNGLEITLTIVHQLPSALRRAQATLNRTGGLHALGLLGFDGRAPLSRTILTVSGRASVELVQKARMAAIPIRRRGGRAVDLALAESMTVIGFARDGRFNVYAGVERFSRNSQ